MHAMYTELHCHSYLSFLDGTCSPETLIKRARTLGMTTLALTDHNGVYGLPRFASAAEKAGIKAIYGSELTLDDGSHLVLLARNRSGYTNLCRAITNARKGRRKNDPQLNFDTLAQHTEGLIALSACENGELTQSLYTNGHKAALQIAARYRDVFGIDGYFIELHNHLRPEDGRRNAALLRVATALELPVVATNNVHYADLDHSLLHHVVTCIRNQTSLDAASPLLRVNNEYQLKSPATMRALFSNYPQAIKNTQVIAEQCIFHMRDLHYEFPQPKLPNSQTSLQLLKQAAAHGLTRLYPFEPDPTARRKARTQAAIELRVMHKWNLAGYLMVFKDLVDFCQQENILVSLRGSAPASTLLYCLGLCPIDPLAHDLLFERFASPERSELPDIDLDIEHEKRERVIQYVYKKYGRSHAAMVAEVNTFRHKSAVRDVAKALGLSATQAQQLSKKRDLFNHSNSTPSTANPEDIVNEASNSCLTEQIFELARQLTGAPRHLSIHVGGFIISSQPLNEIVPQEPARMPNRTVIAWDKYDLESLAEDFGVNLIKLDLLGLGMLTLLAKAFHELRTRGDADYQLHSFQYDSRVYEMLCRADTVGLFQLESRAQMSFLPRLKPRNLDDVAISIGAIRPGPGAAHAGTRIARRRAGIEPISYPHPVLRKVLKQTQGVILWQEQVMQVATCCGGYTPGEADQLRRAMSNKRSAEQMNRAVGDLKERMLARGFTPRVADRIREMIVGFAGYGFPRAHAYPFAHIALISATLKLRHPAIFYAALLNSQPMGFYSPHTILWDASRHDVSIRRVDMNHSFWDCTVEGSCGLRLGFRMVEGFAAASAHVLTTARSNGAYRSVADFIRRTGLNRDQLERLAQVGTFTDVTDRRKATWMVGELANLSGPQFIPGLAEKLAIPAKLPSMDMRERVERDYMAMGYSPERHIVQDYRDQLNAIGAKCLTDLPSLPHRTSVQVGGLIICRQQPESANGFTFLTMEDETGLLNIIVHPNVFDQYRKDVCGNPLILVRGYISHEQGATSLISEYFTPLAASPITSTTPQRDFH